MATQRPNLTEQPREQDHYFPTGPVLGEGGGGVVDVNLIIPDVDRRKLVAAGLLTQVSEEGEVIEPVVGLHPDFQLVDVGPYVDAPYVGDWSRVFGDQFGGDTALRVPMWRAWRPPAGFTPDEHFLFVRLNADADPLDPNGNRYWYGVRASYPTPPTNLTFRRIGTAWSTPLQTLGGVDRGDMRVFHGSVWTSPRPGSSIYAGQGIGTFSQWFVVGGANSVRPAELLYRPYPLALPFVFLSYGTVQTTNTSNTADKTYNTQVAQNIAYNEDVQLRGPAVIPLGAVGPVSQANFRGYNNLNWDEEPGG